jgi:hypothetical protein
LDAEVEVDHGLNRSIIARREPLAQQRPEGDGRIQGPEVGLRGLPIVARDSRAADAASTAVRWWPESHTTRSIGAVYADGADLSTQARKNPGR